MDKKPLEMYSGIDSRVVKFKQDQVKTWILDPPYNIGFEYDACKDNLQEEEYDKFILESIQNMLNHSNQDSNLFYINYPENIARQFNEILKIGYEFKQWVSWVYNSSMGHSKNKFTRSHRAIVWFTSGNPKTNIKAVQRKYKDPTQSRIKERIKQGSRGCNLYDWWEIQLVKAGTKEHKGYSNQIPEKIIKNCILVSTDKGDIVGDIMAGSGSTMQVALTYDRECVISDLNPKASIFWDSRLEDQEFFPKATLFQKWS
jgi:DNA modification methylase